MEPSILITGADHGLGFSMTEKCLEEGFQVYACLLKSPSVNMQRLKEQYGEKLEMLQMDVSDDSSVKNAAIAISDYTDTIDILMNNAGIHPTESFFELEKVDFDIAMKTINVNALGPLRVTKAFLPYLERGYDRMLINISSEAGSIADNWRDREFDYCMSKAALNRQSVMLQQYLKPKGIKVLAIHPGWMKSGMTSEEADIHPRVTAEGLLILIDKYRGDLEGPIYMDYTGKLMRW